MMRPKFHATHGLVALLLLLLWTVLLNPSPLHSSPALQLQYIGWKTEFDSVRVKLNAQFNEFAGQYRALRTGILTRVFSREPIIEILSPLAGSIEKFHRNFSMTPESVTAIQHDFAGMRNAHLVSRVEQRHIESDFHLLNHQGVGLGCISKYCAGKSTIESPFPNRLNSGWLGEGLHHSNRPLISHTRDKGVRGTSFGLTPPYSSRHVESIPYNLAIFSLASDSNRRENELRAECGNLALRILVPSAGHPGYTTVSRDGQFVLLALKKQNRSGLDLGPCRLSEQDNEQSGQFHLRLHDSPTATALSAGDVLTIRGYRTDITWDGVSWFQIVAIHELTKRDLLAPLPSRE